MSGSFRCLKKILDKMAEIKKINEYEWKIEKVGNIPQKKLANKKYYMKD